MKSGIYALASMDGGPLGDGDLTAMGLARVESGSVLNATTTHCAPGFAGRTCDSIAPEAADWFVDEQGTTGFLGYLDEPEQLSASLGLRSHAGPAQLAWSAVERFGDEAAERILGEWTLIRWDVQRRALLLLTSEVLRDSVYFATDGRRVAIAPEMLRLAQLDWVGKALDPEGLALMLSRAGLRHRLRYETPWRGISRAVPATGEIFAIDRRRSIPPRARQTPDIWTGTFDDAVNALEAVGRRITGQTLARYGRTAFLLSGGLDSTLLTSLGAQEQGKSREMFCLSSVAPEGSGLADEREFSVPAAEQLGVPIHFVCPPESPGIYRPADAVFAHLQHPAAGVRHYLYEALLQRAAAGGAKAVVDGVYGELSITNGAAAPAQVGWLRAAARVARAWKQQRRVRQKWPGQTFHVHFSPGFLETLPREWSDDWQGSAALAPPERAILGFHPALRKNANLDTSTASGVRHLTPFRDRRLLRVAASLPVSYLQHEGVSRALGRAMLKGRVPEFVRLRPGGMGFSPDYERRLQKQAEQARSRIADFRKAGLGHWVDFEKLSVGLSRLSEGKPVSVADAFRTQQTAILAEFLLWQQSYVPPTQRD